MLTFALVVITLAVAASPVRAFLQPVIWLQGAQPQSATSGMNRHNIIALGAGFGKESAEKAKAIGSGNAAVSKQEMAFADMIKAGKPVGVVYARVPEEEWLKVGEVTAETKEGLNLAAHAQKRLILERAVILHTNLILKKKELEVGLQVEEDAGIELVKKVPFKGETVGLQMDYVMGSGFFKNAKAPSQEAQRVARDDDKAQSREEEAAAAPSP